MLDADWQERIVASNPAHESQMTNGTICGYEVTFPWGAGEYDRLRIRMDVVHNVKVYITEAASYFARDLFEYRLEEGEFVSVTYPSVAFVTVVSASSDPGSFRIGYSYEDRGEAAGLSEERQEAGVIEDKEVESVPFVHSTDFFVLALVLSVVASLLLLGCVLCCALHRLLKRRQNRVVVINDNKD